MSFLTGSSKSETSVPAFVTDGGKYGADRSTQLAEMGYMPYFGPDVAALSPQQYAGMQNTQQAANAFGMASTGGGQGAGQGGMSDQQAATGQYQAAQVGDSDKAQFIDKMYLENLGRAPDQAGYDYYMSQDINTENPAEFAQGFNAGIPLDPMTGLPAAGKFGGVSGYSSGPVYMEALKALAQLNPGQLRSYNDMFINPQTGAGPQAYAQNAQGQQGGILAALLAAEGDNRGGYSPAGWGGDGQRGSLGDAFGGISDAFGGIGDRLGGAVSGAINGWKG